MAGAGGKTMVKLKIAEALQGKSIVLVPTGKNGAAVQTIDVNQLIRTYVSNKALPADQSNAGGQQGP